MSQWGLEEDFPSDPAYEGENRPPPTTLQAQQALPFLLMLRDSRGLWLRTQE